MGRIDNQNWHIREAEAQDATALQRCMERAYSTYQERMGGHRLPPMDVDYADEIGEFPVWIAESDHALVGALIMVFEKEAASVANIAVHPSFQGMGIGGGLLRFAEQQAQERRYSTLHLTTHLLLSENLSLYRHLGWIETRRDDLRVYMEKELNT